MASVSFLIDDAGRLWDIDSFQLRAELDGFAAGSVFPDYVVKNLGFVRVDRRGQSATIWLRPATVAPIALAELMYWLVDGKFERVLVNSFLHDAWQHTMVGAAEKSFTSLATMLSSAAHLELSQEAVIARSSSVSRMPADSPLTHALQLWWETSGDWHKMQARDFGTIVKARYSLFERQGGSFFVHGYGTGLPDCAKAWFEKAVGSPVHDHPDQRYGLSCLVNYRTVLDNGQPELQEIDALVSWPGNVRQRRRYKRLLLPLSIGQRLGYLLSATAEDISIDLRSVG